MLFNVTSLPPKKILATSQPITIINKQITFLMELNYKSDIEINAELAFDKCLVTKKYKKTNTEVTSENDGQIEPKFKTRMIN